MKQKVYNLIILDESGSMSTIQGVAVSGVNETLQTIQNAQREHPEMQQFVTLVSFNSLRIHSPFFLKEVDVEEPLNWTDYLPDGCTPLYDAIGISIQKLREVVTDEDVVLVTIITDGLENASREYSGSMIRHLVCELKEKGWVFAYIGTNHDVDAVADNLDIHSRASYDCSLKGAGEMFEMENRSRRSFYERLSSVGRCFLMEEDIDYFNQDNGNKEKSKCKINWNQIDSISF